jgi:hypothetical protein
MFENKMLSRIYKRKREVIGWLRKLGNKERHYVCSPTRAMYRECAF